MDERLITLLAITDEGGFAKAARALNLSQPAVSYQMHIQFRRESMFHRSSEGGHRIFRNSWFIMESPVRVAVCESGFSFNLLLSQYTHFTYSSMSSNASSPFLASGAASPCFTLVIVRKLSPTNTAA